MSTHLLVGLSPTSRFLLHLAAQQEIVPVHMASSLPLASDPEAAAAAMVARGLLAAADLPGVYSLGPMGYALRDEILADWPALHGVLRAALIERLGDTCGLGPDDPLRAAFTAIDRAAFIAPALRCLADLDAPAPVGVGDLHSTAPHAVLAILQAAAPKPGERVLICGVRGGFTLALAGALVGAEGIALGLDWRPQVVAHVSAVLSGFPQLSGHTSIQPQRDVTLGHATDHPWDVVLVCGSVPKIPRHIIEQLHPTNGRIMLFLHEPGETGRSCYVLKRAGDAFRDEALSRLKVAPIFGLWGWDQVRPA